MKEQVNLYKHIKENCSFVSDDNSKSIFRNYVFLVKYLVHVEHILFTSWASKYK